MTNRTVEIAVLGPVVVTGAAEPFRRPAALELAVYLAFHRRPVPHAEWSHALWPEGVVASSTVHSTSSDCRRALGRSAGNGLLHLPRGVCLRMRDTVTTDVEQFAGLAEAGDRPSVLAAMALVRGPLFAGLRRTDWAVFDGTQARIEALVVGVALGGAEDALDGGRGEASEWITRQALRLSPYDERLHRALLRTLDAQGNRTGLRAAMGHLRVLSGGAVHPQTVALYRHLLRRRPVASGLPARL